MNIEALLPEVGSHSVRDMPDVASDLHRIETMWATQLEASGGPFLFGKFCAADAYFAPVCCRFQSYRPPLTSRTWEYTHRVLALPALISWCEAARAEHDFVPEDEPYRSDGSSRSLPP